jgi:hypothetical protein
MDLDMQNFVRRQTTKVLVCVCVIRRVEFAGVAKVRNFEV